MSTHVSEPKGGDFTRILPPDGPQSAICVDVVDRGGVGVVAEVGWARRRLDIGLRRSGSADLARRLGRGAAQFAAVTATDHQQ